MMNKEVKDQIKKMIEKDLAEKRRLLANNKYQINKLAKEQRVLKATTGALYLLLKKI